MGSGASQPTAIPSAGRQQPSILQSFQFENSRNQNDPSPYHSQSFVPQRNAPYPTSQPNPQPPFSQNIPRYFPMPQPAQSSDTLLGPSYPHDNAATMAHTASTRDSSPPLPTHFTSPQFNNTENQFQGQ